MKLLRSVEKRWRRLRATELGICVSTPKSGRTWLRVMLDRLEIPLQYAHAGSHLHLTGFTDPTEFVGRYRAKILFLHRDPRDVVVSGYFEATRRVGLYNGDISTFIREPQFGIERIARFNMAWLQLAAGRRDIHVESYERLHADCAGALRMIAGFFGRQLDDQALAAAVDGGRFDTMKRREAAGAYDSYGDKLKATDPTDPDSYKVRRGKVGGFTDYLTEADQAYCASVMHRVGLLLI